MLESILSLPTRLVLESFSFPSSAGEERYQQKPLENKKSEQCVVYLETPSPPESSIMPGVRYMAVAKGLVHDLESSRG